MHLKLDSKPDLKGYSGGSPENFVSQFVQYVSFRILKQLSEPRSAIHFRRKPTWACAQRTTPQDILHCQEDHLALELKRERDLLNEEARLGFDFLPVRRSKLKPYDKKSFSWS